MFASAHEGQLDMLAVLLHNSPMDVSQVEPHVFKLLQAEGDLFAFQKDRRSEEGALKAIIEYADFTVAMNVASKLNGLIIDVSCQYLPSLPLTFFYTPESSTFTVSHC